MRVGREVQCYACRTTFLVTEKREPPLEEEFPGKDRALSKSNEAGISAPWKPSPATPPLQREPADAPPPSIKRPREHPRRPFRRKPRQQTLTWIIWFVALGLGLALIGLGVILTVTFWPSPKGQVSPAGRSAPAGWQDVVSKEGGFRVLMPGSPRMTDSVVHTRLGSLQVKAYDIDSGDSEFSVFYGDLDSSGLANVSSEEWIDAVRDIYIVRSKAILLDEKILSFHGRFGKETRYEISGLGKVARRMYAVNGRIYTLNVASKKQGAQEDSIARFFDSFEILAGSP
jgi:hypothetical protein